MLQPSDGPLCETYDLALLDLDGVVYIGPDAVPGAPRHLTALCPGIESGQLDREPPLERRLLRPDARHRRS